MQAYKLNLLLWHFNTHDYKSERDNSEMKFFDTSANSICKNWISQKSNVSLYTLYCHRVKLPQRACFEACVTGVKLCLSFGGWFVLTFSHYIYITPFDLPRGHVGEEGTAFKMHLYYIQRCKTLSCIQNANRINIQIRTTEGVILKAI